MTALPYTIRIFVPDGDPKGLRIIDKMNWTGMGLVFPREILDTVLSRSEMRKAGVYILVGRSDEDDDPLPTIYIGQTDDLCKRLTRHAKDKNKTFWDRACVFISTNDGLNRAHITWLEYELIRLSQAYGQATVNNATQPLEPTLTEAEKADTRAFLHEMLQIMPLVGLYSFEQPKTIRPTDIKSTASVNKQTPDTLIVPAKEDGFRKVFLSENAWYAVRISGGMLGNIKYIAAYQTQPISAITHFAPVESIIPYGDSGKYKIVFTKAADQIGPIPYGDLPGGAMQSPRYTSFSKLKKAETMSDLF